MYYLNNFFLFAVFGHLFETIVFYIIGAKRKSAFLYLWWTPFYGIGVVLSIMTDKIVSKYIKKAFFKDTILFLFHFVMFSILEFSGGVLLHLIYKKDFWNYSKIPFNVGKYISVPTSLFWSLFAFIYLHFIKKYTDKLINKIPKILTIISSIIFAIDLIVTLLKAFIY